MRLLPLLAFVVVASVGCGGGGGGGGGLHVQVENATSETITRIEFLDLSDSVVAAADLDLPPGGTWSGNLAVGVGQYWVVTYGDDGLGGTCSSDPHDLGEDGLTAVDPGDHNFIFRYEGLLCDSGN